MDKVESFRLGFLSFLITINLAEIRQSPERSYRLRSGRRQVWVCRNGESGFNNRAGHSAACTFCERNVDTSSTSESFLNPPISTDHQQLKQQSTCLIKLHVMTFIQFVWLDTGQLTNSAYNRHQIFPHVRSWLQHILVQELIYPGEETKCRAGRHFWQLSLFQKSRNATKSKGTAFQ